MFPQMYQPEVIMNNLTIVANTKVLFHLKCSCDVELWKILLVTAEQYRKGEDIVCPRHGQPHDFSTCPIFKDWALKFSSDFKRDNNLI